jgi:hypothetical protein
MNTRPGDLVSHAFVLGYLNAAAVITPIKSPVVTVSALAEFWSSSASSFYWRMLNLVLSRYSGLLDSGTLPSLLHEQFTLRKLRPFFSASATPL